MSRRKTKVKIAQSIIWSAYQFTTGGKSSSFNERGLLQRLEFLADKFLIKKPDPGEAWSHADVIRLARAVAAEVQKKCPNWCAKQLAKLGVAERVANSSDSIKFPWKTSVAAPTAGHQQSQKAIDNFYKSWEWRRLRYDFIKAKKRKCMCCGRSPSDGIVIHVDHIKPIRRYWHLRLDINNLQILCEDCNHGKGSRDETDWRSSLNGDGKVYSIVDGREVKCPR